MTSTPKHPVEHVIAVCRKHKTFVAAAQELEMSPSRVRQIAKKNAPDLFYTRTPARKKTLNYEAIIKTFTQTLSIRATAREHNANVEWTRQILMRFAPPEIFARRQAPGFAQV